MTCDDFQGRYLAHDRTAEVDAHLAGCGWCRSRLADLDAITNRLTEPAMWEAPSPDLESDIVALFSRSSRPDLLGGSRLWLWSAVAALVLVVTLSTVFILDQRPDWDIALPAVGGLEATASVAGWNTDSGTRMVLSIDGLEPADNDEYYEIWMTSEDGRHVSAGTFRASGIIETFAGVSRRDFPRIWVTLEPNDGNEGIGGPTVLDTHS